MTRRDNITRSASERACGWTCWSCWESCHIEPQGSRTGNPLGDHVFLGQNAVAYKAESWGACGRHLSLGLSSKVAIDGPFEAVLGKTRRTKFKRGKGKPEALIEPAGRTLPYSVFCLAIVLVIAACFVAGLVARHAIGRHFSRSIKQQLITVYPKYGIYKDLLAGKIGGGWNVPSLCPVLVKKDGVFLLAFHGGSVGERRRRGLSPRPHPDAWSGTIALVTPENVRRLEVSFTERRHLRATWT